MALAAVGELREHRYVQRFEPPFLPTFAELLDLEEIDRDLYLGLNEVPVGAEQWPLYGGQVAAQALMAASLTVPEGRFPHSLHGYFLRRGQRERPMIYRVERDRDGRSFSTRRVSAVQDGEVAFDLVASFQIDRDGPELTTPVRVPDTPPEDCLIDEAYRNTPSMEARMAPPVKHYLDGRNASDRLWVRMREPVVGRIANACAVAYMSDISCGYAIPGDELFGIQVASLDHALWFQEPVDTHQWCVVDLDPMMAGRSRGLYRGSIHGSDGAMAASLTQQVLFL